MSTAIKHFLIFTLINLIIMPGALAQWKLVWSDEFDKDGAPDPAVWQPEIGFVRNHEEQWYQGENAYCKNGYLIIEAKKERVKNPKYIANSQNWKENKEFAAFTSASIITRNKQSFQYGRFEMKAKIDTRMGIWPAFWTLGNEGEWPDNGEIDIMEYYRGMLLANIAWGSGTRYKPVWNTVKIPFKDLNDPEWSEKFHVWRMDWDEKSIRLYLDDKLINSQDIDQTTKAGSAIQPFRQPHYILLGMALGGDNGGDLSKTTFPAKYEIDYVRVYQKE